MGQRVGRLDGWMRGARRGPEGTALLRRSGMGQRSWRRPRSLLWGMIPVFLLLSLLTKSNPRAHGVVMGVFLDIPVLISVVATGWAVVRSRHLPARTRRVSWALLVGFLAQGATGAAIGLILRGNDEVLGPIVAGCLLHLAFVVALLVAVLSFPGPRRTGREWTGLLLDMLIVTGSGAMACWYFIIGPALHSGAGPAQTLFAVSLPVLDLVMVSGSLLVLLRGVTAGRHTLTLLVTGIFAVTVPGLHLARGLAHADGETVALPFVLELTFMTGLTVLAIASLEHLDTCRNHRPPVETTEPIPGITYVPYLAVLGGFALLTVAVANHGTYPWSGLVLGTVLMFGGMTMRQMLALSEIRRLATTDAMTGVANRVSLTHGLEQAIDRAQRTGVPGAVMLFDLNGFKQINDTLGHAAGDIILTTFAAALRRNVLGTDAVGRLGGDEFAVVLHDIRTPQDAVVVAERILADLAEPADINGHPEVSRTSIGIALINADGDAAAQVLHRADTAMYEAKRNRPANTSTWQVYLDTTSTQAGQTP